MTNNEQTIEELNKVFTDKDKEFLDYKDNIVPGLLEKTLREMVLDSKDININVDASFSSSINIRVGKNYNYDWGLEIIIEIYSQDSEPKIKRNFGLPTNEEQLEFENILLSDVIKKTGWYSAFKMVTENLYNLKQKRLQAQIKYQEKVDKEERNQFENQKEKFYSIVKAGYVIPIDSYESYVIQKVAIKNVHVMHFKDRHITRKRAIKKDEFFNKISRYVDLTDI